MDCYIFMCILYVVFLLGTILLVINRFVWCIKLQFDGGIDIYILCICCVYTVVSFMLQWSSTRGLCNVTMSSTRRNRTDTLFRVWIMGMRRGWDRGLSSFDHILCSHHISPTSPTTLKQGVIKGQLWEGIVKLFQEVGSQQQPNTMKRLQLYGRRRWREDRRHRAC